jgi:hypothetical protein
MVSRSRRNGCETAYAVFVPGRTSDVAHELRLVIRRAATRPDQLAGQLPVLSGFARVQAASERGEEAQLHAVLYDLIPEYANRLPKGPNGLAIRELLMWRDEHGQPQTLDTRYRKAAEHIVCSTTDFGRRREKGLLNECAQYFIQFDHKDRAERPEADSTVLEPPLVQTSAEAITEDAALPIAPEDPSVGLASISAHLDYHRLADEMRSAKRIEILNTWIPELNFFEPTLIQALADGAHVRVLMLHPDSPAAPMRSAGLRGSVQARFHENRVRLGVRQCLDVFANIASALDDDGRSRLRVALYDSLPSIAVYSVDERALVSVFLHGQLAISSPQIAVHGRQSLLGNSVFGEIQELWDMAYELADIGDWRTEISSINQTSYGEKS